MAKGSTKARTTGDGIGGAEPATLPKAAPVAGTKILLRRSGVKGRLPTAGDAEYGELFINYHSGDPMLCFKDNSDNIVEIKPARSIDGGGGEVPPDTGNTEGDLIWDGTHLRVWDGTTWLAVGPGSLAYIQKADMGTVTNTAGDGCDIPLVNNLQAGLMAPGDKNKLDGYPATPGEISGTLDLQAVTDIGNTTTNGATFGDGKITLNANGAGEFSSFVLSGPGNAINGEEGSGLFGGSGVVACFSNDDSPLWRGYKQGELTETSRIDVDGGATFADGNFNILNTGKTVINTPTAQAGKLDISGDGTLYYSFGGPGGTIGTEGLSLGTNLVNLPFDTKTFLGLDGSASFAGDVVRGTYAANSDYVALRTGQLEIGRNTTRDDLTFIVGTRYNNGVAEENFKITSDGSASFAGRVDVKGGVTVDGGSSLSTGLYYRDDSQTSGLSLYSQGSLENNRKVFIKTDGSANFAGQVECGGNTTTYGVIGKNSAIGGNSFQAGGLFQNYTAGGSAIAVIPHNYVGGNPATAVIREDGSSRFVDRMDIGSNTLTDVALKLQSNHTSNASTLYVQQHGAAGKSLFQGVDGSNTVVIDLKNDGSSRFVGNFLNTGTALGIDSILEADRNNGMVSLTLAAR